MPNERGKQEALDRVDAFIAQHSEYTRKGINQGAWGNTNQIVLARRKDERVVFKVFCEDERKERESFAMRHWNATGLVPELIQDVDSRMIVMSHIPGNWFGSGEVTEDSLNQTSIEIGTAFGTLASVPLSAADRASFESRFYGKWNTLERYLGRILDLGRGVQERDPDFADGFWKDSLDFIQSQFDTILLQSRILYHQDAANYHVFQEHFSGFFDLEMCFVGCQAMQLGSILGAFCKSKEKWDSFRQGWEEGTGKPITEDERKAAVAAQQLLCWRVITRYLRYDGTIGTGFDGSSPADPVRWHSAISSASQIILGES